MTASPDEHASYRTELTRLARLLADPNQTTVESDMCGANEAELRSFVQDNRGKRVDKLLGHLGFLNDAFDDLDARLQAYAATGPLRAYDNIASDADRFLDWLDSVGEPTSEQQDYIACQRARHSVVGQARKNRGTFLRFQDLLTVASALGVELNVRDDLRVHFNPTHAWARMQTHVLLEDGINLPADLLFFAVRSEIRTASLDDDCRRFARALAEGRPKTVAEWVDGENGSPEGRTALVMLCQQLIDTGIVALS